MFTKKGTSSQSLYSFGTERLSKVVLLRLRGKAIIFTLGNYNYAGVSQYNAILLHVFPPYRTATL